MIKILHGGRDGLRQDDDDQAEKEEEASKEASQEIDEEEEKEVTSHPASMLEHPLTSRLLTAAALCLGWGYGEGFPWPWGAAPVSLLRPLGDGGKTNCSTFAAHCQFGAWPDKQWTEAHYRQLMVWDAKDKWSALDPAVELQIARRVSVPTSGEWHLAQSWSISSGHTYFFYAVGDELYILESNVNIGPRWRHTTWAALTDGRDVRIARLLS